MVLSRADRAKVVMSSYSRRTLRSGETSRKYCGSSGSCDQSLSETDTRKGASGGAQERTGGANFRQFRCTFPAIR